MQKDIQIEPIQFKQNLKIFVSQYLEMSLNKNTNYGYDEGTALTGFLIVLELIKVKTMIIKQKEI